MKSSVKTTPGHDMKFEAAVKRRTRLLENTLKALELANRETNRSLAREKEISGLKSSFVSLASHEFRTPLSSILLSASLVEQYFDRLDKQRIFRHLNTIKNAVADLTGVLNDFLSLERIETGKVEAVFKQFELNDFCKAVINEMQQLVKPGQEIIFRSAMAVLYVQLDPNLLRHCVVNLLSNAIKYAPENTRITVSIIALGDRCEIAIADQGMGIPLSQQQHLFEPFFRAENVGGISGTGLGLNIVKRYADLMNIGITFCSRPQTGTTFILSLP